MFLNVSHRRVEEKLEGETYRDGLHYPSSGKSGVSGEKRRGKVGDGREIKDGDETIYRAMRFRAFSMEMQRGMTEWEDGGGNVKPLDKERKPPGTAPAVHAGKKGG